MIEFTGERVVPGSIDADLWNEHLARYAFASRLARRKRVLDAACGTGYGAAELARSATMVVGADIAPEAVAYARQHYPRPNIAFLRADCSALPLVSGAFDLVVAFEVIEHLKDWRAFLSETRRLLAPGGQCVVSTPNKDYYAASRGLTGKNPFHEREFTFDEFRQALREIFPQVTLYVQNHTEGFVFQPVKTFSPAEARLDSGGGGPEEAHFFVAVCAMVSQTGAATFVYIPRAANILREREQHIEKLAGELELKDRRIRELTGERDELLRMFEAQKQELEDRNRWAAELDRNLDAAGARIVALQAELEQQRAGYEAQINEFDKDLREKAAWAQQVSDELTAKCAELAECVEALHATEKTMEERTQWALQLQSRVQELEAQLDLIRASRWMKMGGALGLGPRLRNG